MTEFRNTEREIYYFRLRLSAVGVFVIICFGLLLARFLWLQGFKRHDYAAQAEENRISVVPVVPNRGLIVDRNGVVLARNFAAYTLEITPSKIEKDRTLDEVIDDLSRVVDIQLKDRKRFHKLLEESKNFESTPIRTRLSDEEVARFIAQRYRFPGVEVQARLFRQYPLGQTASHVIGYIGRINQKEQDEIDATDDSTNYSGTEYIGKEGLEKSYEEYLHGTTGYEEVEVSAGGRAVRTLSKTPATPGHNLHLSIDIGLQKVVEDAFGDRRGALVAIEPSTGDVLAYVSMPNFDPNAFVEGIDSQTWNDLNNSPDKPLVNRPLSGTYPPGSTFKPTVAMACLTAGVDPTERVVCTGGWAFGGRVWHCHKKGGHGVQTMHDAIKNSCDVYFYQMALRIGPDPIAAAAKAFGYGGTFDIGIPGQKKGLVGSRDWKKKAFKRDPVWHPGDSVPYGIGQGYINVNALQLAVMTARLANGRKALNPRLVKSVGGVDQPHGDAVPDLPFPQEHLEIVRAGMAAVANDPTGGAFKQSQLGLGDVKMAGKTGTAQVRQYAAGASRSNQGIAWRLKDHNLFIAFAPYDNPRYALSVIIEHGGQFGSSAAAPRAREVMRVALLKDPEIRARIERPMPLPEAPDEGEGDAGAAEAPVVEEGTGEG